MPWSKVERLPRSGIKCEVLHVWNICSRTTRFEAYVHVGISKKVYSDDVFGRLVLDQWSYL